MSRLSWQNASLRGLATILVAVGVMTVVLAPLVLVVECLEWATSTEWPGLTVADGLALFGVAHEVEETDSQRLLDLLMAFPLSIALYFVGLFAALSGINLGDWGNDRDLEAQFLSDD